MASARSSVKAGGSNGSRLTKVKGEQKVPYIITTRHKDFIESTAGLSKRTRAPLRRAVATLDEAREGAAEETHYGWDGGEVPGYNRDAVDAQVDSLTEQGGTVGPLPDGTLIEVRALPMGEIRADLEDADPGWTGDDALALATWCDLFEIDGPAYNAAQ